MNSQAASKLLAFAIVILASMTVLIQPVKAVNTCTGPIDGGIVQFAIVQAGITESELIIDYIRVGETKTYTANWQDFAIQLLETPSTSTASYIVNGKKYDVNIGQSVLIDNQNQLYIKTLDLSPYSSTDSNDKAKISIAPTGGGNYLVPYIFSRGETKTFSANGIDYEVTLSFLGKDNRLLVTLNGIYSGLNPLGQGNGMSYDGFMMQFEEYIDSCSPTVSCTDSDGGTNYYVRGTLRDQYTVNLPGGGLIEYCSVANNQGNYDHVTSCSGTNCYIAEHYCVGTNNHNTILFRCPNGCNNGACLNISIDTVPPVVFGGRPFGVITSVSPSVTMSVSTNEVATCRYSNIPNTPYSSMSRTFTTTGGTTHSVVLSGLASGYNYTYLVKCIDPSGNFNNLDYTINFWSMVYDTTPPSQVTGLTANPLSSSQISLQWNNATDNVGVFAYHVYRNNFLLIERYVNSYTDSGLVPNTSYSYQVVAFDAAANFGLGSSVVSARTLPSSTPNQQTCIDSDGGRNYFVKGRLNHYINAVPSVSEDICGVGGQYLEEYYCQVNGDYDYNIERIYCENGCINGACINVSSNTNWPIISNKFPVGTQTIGSTILTLSIVTNVDANCRYSVNANTAYSNMSQTFSTTGGTMHSRQLSGFVNGQAYTYYVRCQDASGRINSRDEIITFNIASPENIPPTQVTGLSGNAISSSEINLKWNPATDNTEVIGYMIYKSGVLRAQTAATHYEDVALEPNTLYTYTVAAYDPSINIGPQSLPVSVKTLSSNDSKVECTDSDGGLNLFFKGETLGVNAPEGPVILYDACISSTQVREYFCDANGEGIGVYDCPSGYKCWEGACTNVNSSLPDDRIEAPNFLVAISEIGPTSDIQLGIDVLSSLGETYKSSENQGFAKLFKEINGLDLHNKVTLVIFKNQAIVVIGRDVRSSSSGFIRDLRIILQKRGVSDVQAIYSNSITSPDLHVLFMTPDLPTIEFPIPQEISGSADGTGSPSINPICNGCDVDGKCITVGTRTDDSYCGLSGGLVQFRLREETCNNNYECSTNLCVNDRCVNKHVLDRIFDWLRIRIFG